jgi:hypothetical protein
MLAPINVKDMKVRLSYDGETGIFTYKNGRKSGQRAGCLNGQGYRRLCIRSTYIAEHRAAWAMHYGSFPGEILDHINGIKSDNRICNLRLATPSQNVANRGLKSNNTSGLKGITKLPHGRWQAQIRIDGKSKYLGSFDTKEDAAAAYAVVAGRAFGEFHNSGIAS